MNERILVFDGAMGTNLEAQRLTTAQFGGEEFAGCNDHLNLSCPDAVRKVHRSFLEAGVDVIETNTFRSNRFTLGEFGWRRSSSDQLPARGLPASALMNFQPSTTEDLSLVPSALPVNWSAWLRMAMNRQRLMH